MADISAIVFDVGETLVDESRAWTSQARKAGVPVFTFLAVFGSLIERAEDHRKIWGELGIPDPQSPLEITSDDLYPDALTCIESARAAGFIIGIAGNQPSGAARQLAQAGMTADFIASSAQWGVEKPSTAFFERTVDEAGVEAGSVLYVGDRLDNDVLPARRAGMQTAFLVRGPWGYVHDRWHEATLADYRVESLSELAELWETSLR
ncbi:HAD family hydrolase [Corynebacterium sp.]|uniref:HAD family hydrolase n=1 Tax=Corynebacterium sp. TaxID=1720 RepID=UPI003B3B1DB2